MKNKETNDWRDYNLQTDELEMLESIERGEWKTIGNIEKRRQELRNFFSDEQELENNLVITLPHEDLEIIIQKSEQYGISYKELIERLVHNFAVGKILL